MGHAALTDALVTEAAAADPHGRQALRETHLPRDKHGRFIRRKTLASYPAFPAPLPLMFQLQPEGDLGAYLLTQMAAALAHGRPTSVWSGGTIQERCLALLDTIASVCLPAYGSSPSPLGGVGGASSSSHTTAPPPIQNHNIFRHPPYNPTAKGGYSYYCIRVDWEAVKKHPYMTNCDGYLRVRLGGSHNAHQDEFAHRITLWALLGPPPTPPPRPATADGERKPPHRRMVAMHSCSNRDCVCPFHLRWGTDEENLSAHVNRGRLK